jgi:hypothetical protein
MEALTGNPCLLDSEHVMFVIFQLLQPNAAQKVSVQKLFGLVQDSVSGGWRVYRLFFIHDDGTVFQAAHKWSVSENFQFV